MNAAQAEIEGVYVGAGAGVGVDARSCGAAPSCNRTNFSQKIFGGVRLTPGLAAELNQFYFRGLDRANADPVATSTGVASTRESMDATALGINWEVELLHGFTNQIRLGWAYTRREILSLSPSGVATRRNEYSGMPYLGAGLEFSLTSDVRLFSNYDFLIGGHNSHHLFSVGMVADLQSDKRSSEFGKTYVGGALGQGSVSKLSCAGVENCDNTRMGGKVYMGKKITSNVALEVNAMRLGSVRASGLVGGSTPYSLDAKAEALVLGGALRLPTEVVPDLTGVGRLGVAYVRTSLKSTVGTASGNVADDSMQPFWGYGLEYGLTKDLKLTGSIDASKANMSLGRATVRLVTLGAQADF